MQNWLAALLLLTLAMAWTIPPGLETAGFAGPAWADDDDDDNDDDDDRAVRRPRATRAELVVAGLSDEQITALTRRGFRVTRSLDSTLLGTGVSRLLGPSGRGPATALREVRRIAPQATAARNDRFVRLPVDRYRPQGEPCDEACPQFALTGWTPSYLSCARTAPIGVVDTRVEREHPALAGAELKLETVRRPDRRPSDAVHGTGVVSLLIGQPGSSITGLVPRATVVAVDAFHRAGGADATDAFDLVAALDVLAAHDVGVVNMSLSGPDNDVLAVAIRRLIARGTLIVAAAGASGGRTGGYPARYEGVVAVAAIDEALKPSRLSARGAHISYAGPGVGIPVAVPGGTSRLASGTSFATPFVSAAAAVARLQDGGGGDTAAARLRTLAKDLGAPGRDPIFGWGLVQFPHVERC